MNRVAHADLVAAVRNAAIGRAITEAAASDAGDLGLLSNGALSSQGRRLVEAAIRRDDPGVRAVLREAFLAVSALRPLLDGEWGREISREQAEEAIQYGYPPARVWKTGDFTRLFDSLNYAGLVIFNRKRPTVRVLAATPTTRLGKDGGLVTPTTQYRNKRMTVELVRSGRESLFWFDAHLDREALSFIYENADFASVRSVRLLSVGRSAVTAATVDDYERARAELASRGIQLEWRTLLDHNDANKHDRWLRVDDRLWNLPPLSLILRGGKFGSIVPDANKVPLEDWWAAGTDLSAAARRNAN